MIARFLQLFLAGTVRDPAMRDAIAGDLIEDHTTIAAERGRLRAALWLAWQLTASFPTLASLRSVRPSEYSLVRFAAGFYTTLGFLVLLGVAMVILSEQFIGLTDEQPALMAFLLASIAAAVVGGYAAARVARRAPLFASLSLGVICIGAGIAAYLLDEVHATPIYWVVVQLAVVPATCAGGLLRVRHTLSQSSLTDRSAR